MTKKLEDLLNMDDSKEIIKQAEQQDIFHNGKRR